MNYQNVIKNSKFYVPMNLNLGYLLENDTDIIVLMNVINCDTINEKLSVRKLMRYTNRANNTIQQSLTRLRTLKLIEGFKPQYETLKRIFDAINNANTIEERKNWCKVYQDSIQKNVSESGTEIVSESGTQIKKIDKEDIYKKDKIIYNNIYNKEIENNNNILEESNNNKLKENNKKLEKEFEKPIEEDKGYTEEEFESFKAEVDSSLERCINGNELSTVRSKLSFKNFQENARKRKRLYNRLNSYIQSKYDSLQQQCAVATSSNNNYDDGLPF